MSNYPEPDPLPPPLPIFNPLNWPQVDITGGGGLAGLQGPTGATGQFGVQGTQGVGGSTGLLGRQGPQGVPAVAGPLFYNGSNLSLTGVPGQTLYTFNYDGGVAGSLYETTMLSFVGLSNTRLRVQIGGLTADFPSSSTFFNSQYIALRITSRTFVSVGSFVVGSQIQVEGGIGNPINLNTNVNLTEFFTPGTGTTVTISAIGNPNINILTYGCSVVRTDP